MSVKDRAKYGAYLTAGRFFGVCGLRGRQRLSIVVGNAFASYLLRSDDRQGRLAAFSQRLDLVGVAAPVSRAAAEQQFRESVQMFFRRNFDLLWLRIASARTIDKSVTSNLGSTDVFDNPNGCILVVPHVGAWNTGAVYLAHHGAALTVVAERLTDVARDRVRREMLERVGVEVVPFDPKDADAALKVRHGCSDALLRGRTVVVMADIDYERSPSAPAVRRLFGSRYLAPLAGRLALGSPRATLAVGRVVLGADGMIEATVGSAIDGSRDNRDQVETRLHEDLMSIIRQFPLQSIATGEAVALAAEPGSIDAPVTTPFRDVKLSSGRSEPGFEASIATEPSLQPDLFSDDSPRREPPNLV